MAASLNRLMRRFARSSEREILTRRIGREVMEVLRELDEIAYVRFTSVYRNFQDLEAFSDEVERLRETPSDNSSSQVQLSLFVNTRD